ncbi:phosphosulfolactate synthase [Bacillus dakarensis]|uniref:phosphosulfolactate synthase n=1 Tax=Robertmurraya dakarensis TaxID=1926278 RepID=UPI000981D154|nr:phosphosulfolactate synthase [Bacillus dakarensis]
MDFLKLPQRTTGDRTFGLTSIIDFGTPIGELTNILEDYHPFIDIAKIGIGSAYITPNLQKKIDLYKAYNIKPYCGGTLFEKCYSQNKIPEFLQCLRNLGIQWVEVSNGTIEIPLVQRLDLIQKIKKDFNVIAEVGSKDGDKELSISQWKKEMQLLLEAGSEYVITEGRDSGSAGIYSSNGAVKSNLIRELIKDIDHKRIIFEAPTPKHQMYFINEIGANVNLGNVKLNDVLVLEAQRCGLRSETFFLEDSEWKLPL